MHAEIEIEKGKEREMILQEEEESPLHLAPTLLLLMAETLTEKKKKETHSTNTPLIQAITLHPQLHHLLHLLLPLQRNHSKGTLVIEQTHAPKAQITPTTDPITKTIINTTKEMKKEATATTTVIITTIKVVITTTKTKVSARDQSQETNTVRRKTMT